MVKSGLILGAVGLLFGIGAALLTPLCVPCLAIFLGIAAGYLAGVFDKPNENGKAVKKGALSGLIASAGVILGQIIGAVINNSVVGAEGAAEILEQFGYNYGAEYENIYAISQVLGTVCFSFLDIVFMVLLGMLGGFLWWKFTGSKTNPMIVDM